MFHLTARTVRWQEWFTPGIRGKILEAVVDITPRSRVRLLATAVMPNHLHLVVQQGERRLETLMQPLLRRIAGHVHHTHRLEGPIFWRHYSSTPCMDPSHARNAIAYTHLNPVAAGLCDDPADYRWTSHLLYADRPVGASPGSLRRLRAVLDPSLALPLFAAGPTRSLAELRADYRGFMDIRLATDADANGLGGQVAGGAARPPTDPPDWPTPTWGSALSAGFQTTRRPRSMAGDDGLAHRTLDLATLTRHTLAAEAPGVALDDIRGRGGDRRRVHLRHLLILRLHAAGHSNVAIADFLNLSPSAVSYVIRKRQNGR